MIEPSTKVFTQSLSNATLGFIKVITASTVDGSVMISKSSSRIGLLCRQILFRE
jgi:hypothetical protein